MDTYQNLIFSICYKITQNYFDAEDMAQDTFLSAFKCLSQFDGKNEKAWICKIATNKCLDYLKRAGRRTIPTEDSFFLTLESNQNSPEDTYLSGEIKEQLYKMCTQLKSPYQEVAIDYFYHEMDIAQIAQNTGKNIKTLQTQIYRSKAMLKKLYRKE